MIDAFAEPGKTKELRLAVVCYGGVSLAIYMHGTTKELHRLVKASILLDRNADDAAYGPSERVYRNMLRDLEGQHPDKVRTRVVVDIVAGTSARRDQRRLPCQGARAQSPPGSAARPLAGQGRHRYDHARLEADPLAGPSSLAPPKGTAQGATSRRLDVRMALRRVAGHGQGAKTSRRTDANAARPSARTLRHDDRLLRV